MENIIKLAINSLEKKRSDLRWRKYMTRLKVTTQWRNLKASPHSTDHQLQPSPTTPPPHLQIKKSKAETG